MSAPAPRRLLRDVRRALAPHGPVAVVHLLVLKEHGRHHRQVRHRLARRDGRDGLLGEHHGLDREDVHPAFGQRLRLLLEGGQVLLVRRELSPTPYSSGRQLVGPMEPAT